MASLTMWRELNSKTRKELYDSYRSIYPNIRYSQVQKDFDDWYNGYNTNNKNNIVINDTVIPYINGIYDTDLSYNKNEPTVILPEIVVTAKKKNIQNNNLANTNMLKSVLYDSTIGPFLNITDPITHIGNIVHGNYDNTKDYIVDALNAEYGLLSKEFANKHPVIDFGVTLGTDILLGKISNSLKNKYKQYSPVIRDILDPYTTLNGRLGYYDNNTINRFISTVKRNNNIPDIPRIPEVIRKLNTGTDNIIKIENNQVRLTPIESRFEYDHILRPDEPNRLPITNMTMNAPVRDHAGVWNNNHDVYIFNGNYIFDKFKPTSIDPSDTFFAGQTLTTTPKNTTLLSGNKTKLKLAKKQGLETYSSKKARKLYETAIRNSTDKNWENYANELHNLYLKRGKQSIDDYKLLEAKTGLNSHTFDKNNLKITKDNIYYNNKSIFDYNNLVDDNLKFINEMLATKTKRDAIFNNTNVYQDVLYDPYSPIESLKRNEWGIILKK